MQLLAHGPGGQVQRLAAEEALKGCTHLGIYFSASWCPPCRGFTPVLAQVHDSVRARPDGGGFRVLFVSADRDPAQFQVCGGWSTELLLDLLDRWGEPCARCRCAG